MQPLLQWKSNKYYIFCVCVCVPLGIHHAIHLHHIVICSLSGSKYFSTLSYKWQFFLKTVIDHKMSVFIFSTTFVQNILILRRKEQDVINNLYWSSNKVLIIFVRF